MAPALAVADALRADGAEVAFIGGDRAEAELVPKAGYELHTIAVEGVSRSNPLHAIRALVRAVLAVPRTRAILKELRPDAVLGGGGYVTAPVGLAALSLRIPLVLTEADSHLGLANRLLARGARRVCLAFAISGREGSRYRVTGRPIPVPDADRTTARVRFGIAEGETCVLVFGGSLGARSINLAAIDAFANGAFHVLHIAGRRDYPELAGRELPPRYDLREYLNLDELRASAGRRRPGRSALGGVGVRDRGVWVARDPGPVPIRLRRSSDRERPLDGGRGSGGCDPRRRAER